MPAMPRERSPPAQSGGQTMHDEMGSRLVALCFAANDPVSLARLLGRCVALGHRGRSRRSRRTRTDRRHHVHGPVRADVGGQDGTKPAAPRPHDHVAGRSAAIGRPADRARRPPHRHRPTTRRATCRARRPRGQRALPDRAREQVPRRLRTSGIDHLRRHPGGRRLLECCARLAAGLGPGRRDRDPRPGRNGSDDHVGRPAGGAQERTEPAAPRHRPTDDGRPASGGRPPRLPRRDSRRQSAKATSIGSS